MASGTHSAASEPTCTQAAALITSTAARHEMMKPCSAERTRHENAAVRSPHGPPHHTLRHGKTHGQGSGCLPTHIPSGMAACCFPCSSIACPAGQQRNCQAQCCWAEPSQRAGADTHLCCLEVPLERGRHIGSLVPLCYIPQVVEIQRFPAEEDGTPHVLNRDNRTPGSRAARQGRQVRLVMTTCDRDDNNA